MNYEQRMKSLLKRKQDIYALEQEREKNKLIWKESGKQVKSLSQQMGIKTRELMEAI